MIENTPRPASTWPSIWADKLALTLIGLIVAGVFLSWAMVVAAAGIEGANHVLASTGISWIADGVAGTALLWIVLRAVDFLRGGPTRAVFAMHRGPDIAHPARR